MNGLLAGTQALLYKEVLRFWKVSFQTVAAPVLTAILYLLIFGHVLEGQRRAIETHDHEKRLRALEGTKKEGPTIEALMDDYR